FSMYASFPTAPLKETDRLSVIASSDEIKLLWQHNINVHGMDILLHPDDLTAIINWTSSQGSPSVGEILAKFSTLDTGKLWRSLTWMLKLGIMRLG
ncbi:MAG: hypothetical protein PHX43_01250, partial [Alphaproteobacteria bacterium]|nr:hypothetical protein [Alphaproteobacteria bacterium]